MARYKYRINVGPWKGLCAIRSYDPGVLAAWGSRWLRCRKPAGRLNFETRGATMGSKPARHEGRICATLHRSFGVAWGSLTTSVRGAITATNTLSRGAERSTGARKGSPCNFRGSWERWGSGRWRCSSVRRRHAVAAAQIGSCVCGCGEFFERFFLFGRFRMFLDIFGNF